MHHIVLNDRIAAIPYYNSVIRAYRRNSPVTGVLRDVSVINSITVSLKTLNVFRNYNTFYNAFQEVTRLSVKFQRVAASLTLIVLDIV